MTVAMPDAAFEFSKLEPAGVYQEAAINLRYKSITAITAPNLQRAMALLQLESRFLIERGLASRSSLEQGLDWSDEGPNSGNSGVEASWPQNDLYGIEEKIDDIQDDQNDGWSDYEDDSDSDSDIDDDEGQDEIEGRGKGPIYAFLVYGGVQLRPDEYVLLFRALGVSPQYVEQLNQSNNAADLKLYKAPVHSLYTHPSVNAQRRGCIIGSKASPTERRSGNGFSRREIVDSRGILEKHGKPFGGRCRHLLRHINAKICPSGSDPKHVPGAGSPQKPPDLLPQKQIMRKLSTERRASGLRKVVPENEVCVYEASPISGQRGCRKSSNVRDYDGERNSYKSRSFKGGALRRIRWGSGCRGISGVLIREKSEVF